MNELLEFLMEGLDPFQQYQVYQSYDYHNRMRSDQFMQMLEDYQSYQTVDSALSMQLWLLKGTSPEAHRKITEAEIECSNAFIEGMKEAENGYKLW